jgi:predicted ATPase
LVRVERSIDLLQGPRDAPARQRTLQATLDWSYELLTEGERTLLRRLSYFDGFDLEAAEAVSRGNLDAVGSLVDKSLVKRVAVDRFLILQTIRDYARVRSQNEGDALESQLWHARWFASRVAEISPMARGPRMPEFLAWYDAEADNLWTALDALLAASQSDEAFDLVDRLVMFWRPGRVIRQGIGWLELALELTRTPSAHRATALAWLGELYERTGNFARAESISVEAIAEAEQVRAIRPQAIAGRTMAWIANHRGDGRVAVDRARQALSLAEESGDLALAANLTMELGVFLVGCDELDEAESLLERSLAYHRENEDPLNVAFAQGNLAELAIRRGDTQCAITNLKEARTVFLALGCEGDAALASCFSAYAFLADDQRDAAARSAYECLQLARQLDETGLIVAGLDGIALATISDDPLSAARLWGAARAHGDVEEWALRQPICEPLLAKLQELLGREAFEAALAEGAALGIEAAIELAIDIAGDAACGSSRSADAMNRV